MEQILANSPQAKGRVERLWGTFQDRLTSELRLARATTKLEVQDILVDMLPRHNRHFMVPALDDDPAWVPWPTDRMLTEYFCFKYRRVVARDNTVSFEGYRLDIPPQPGGSLARARIKVQQRFDGTLAIYRNGACLVTKRHNDPPAATRVETHSPAPDDPPPLKPAKPTVPSRQSATWKPDAGHP